MLKRHIAADNYSRKYIKEHNKKLSYEAVIASVRRKYVLKSLNMYNHKHILEIGCGLEPLFLFCSGYKSYTIVEPSIEFVKNASRLARVKGEHHIDIIHGHMEEAGQDFLRQKKSYFDFIILSSILHEVRDYKALLRLIHKICKRNTIVHINVPNVYSLHRLIAREAGYIKSIFDASIADVEFKRCAHFDKRLLFNAVMKSGFEVLSFGTYFIKPFSNEQMEKIINQNIIGKDIIKGLEKVAKFVPGLGCEMFVDCKASFPRGGAGAAC